MTDLPNEQCVFLKKKKISEEFYHGGFKTIIYLKTVLTSIIQISLQSKSSLEDNYFAYYFLQYFSY